VNSVRLLSGKRLLLLAWAGLGTLCSPLAVECFAQASTAPLTVDQVVAQMTKRNQQRAEALRPYTSLRTYQCEYHGFGDRRAELVVKMSFTPPGKKEFTIVSESGSEILRKHVLKRLVEAEEDATSEENRRSTAMQPENYEFQLVEVDEQPGGNFYVLEVRPRHSNKYLFRGRIWVDAKDFAVTRMRGEPARNPSWWVKKVSMEVEYRKIGDFWLLARNETLTQVRFRGRAVTTIDYADYELGGPGGSPASISALPGAASTCAGGAAPGACTSKDDHR